MTGERDRTEEASRIAWLVAAPIVLMADLESFGHSQTLHVQVVGAEARTVPRIFSRIRWESSYSGRATSGRPWRLSSSASVFIAAARPPSPYFSMFDCTLCRLSSASSTATSPKYICLQVGHVGMWMGLPTEACHCFRHPVWMCPADPARRAEVNSLLVRVRFDRKACLYTRVGTPHYGLNKSVIRNIAMER
eukprot:3111424-Pyramimonas_sp.AAC.2